MSLLDHHGSANDTDLNALRILTYPQIANKFFIKNALLDIECTNVSKAHSDNEDSKQRASWHYMISQDVMLLVAVHMDLYACQTQPLLAVAPLQRRTRK